MGNLLPNLHLHAFCRICGKYSVTRARFPCSLPHFCLYRLVCRVVHLRYSLVGDTVSPCAVIIVKCRDIILRLHSIGYICLIHHLFKRSLPGRLVSLCHILCHAAFYSVCKGFCFQLGRLDTVCSYPCIKGFLSIGIPCREFLSCDCLIHRSRLRVCHKEHIYFVSSCNACLDGRDSGRNLIHLQVRHFHSLIHARLFDLLHDVLNRFVIPPPGSLPDKHVAFLVSLHRVQVVFLCDLVGCDCIHNRLPLKVRLFLLRRRLVQPAALNGCYRPPFVDRPVYQLAHGSPSGCFVRNIAKLFCHGFQPVISVDILYLSTLVIFYSLASAAEDPAHGTADSSCIQNILCRRAVRRSCSVGIDLIRKGGFKTF